MVYYFHVDDKYVNYSTYLRTLVNTKIHVDSYNNGEDIVYILDFEPHLINNYINFLKTGRIDEMTNELEEFYDFMGHSNNMSYPLDFLVS